MRCHQDDNCDKVSAVFVSVLKAIIMNCLLEKPVSVI